MTFGGLIAAFWVMAAALLEPAAQWRKGQLGRMPGSVWGMTLAHLGLGVFILGAVVTESYSVEMDQAVRPGESITAAGYEFRFDGLTEAEGPNYTAVRATVPVFRDGRQIALLHPEKRVYRVQQSPMTEAGIDPALSRDLYAALGDPLGGGAWSMRVQYKPLVRLIWLGCLIMAAGGLVAVADRRYRRAREARRADIPEGVAGETG
jgi:cytochrome c-type biogenesis protein CcmF